MPLFDLTNAPQQTRPRFLQKVIFPRSFLLVARVPQEGVILDVTPPTIEDISPSLGSQLQKMQSIAFSVIDNLGSFSRIIVAVKYATGVQELAHDGDAFVGHYVTTSFRAQVTGGFRYTILRAGGWPSAPTPRIFPIDESGNDGT